MHAAACDACGVLLSDMGSGGEDEDQPNLSETLALKSSTARWKRDMTARIAAELTMGGPVRIRLRWRVIGPLVAAAAAVFIVMGTSSSAALWFLAHSGQRPFEFRVEGAPYQPVQNDRGAADEDTVALQATKLLVQLRQRLEPDSADWLHAQGRAAILEKNGTGSEAIAKLTAANAEAPRNVGILNDLGIAFLLRGRLSNSTPEVRSEDTAHAISVLNDAIKIRPQPLLLFNLALAYEQQLSWNQAIAVWNRLLQVESSGGWSEEARRHIREIQSRQRARVNVDRIPAEDTILPLVTRGFRSSSAYNSAEISRTLLARHGDPWMRDMLVPRNSANASGISDFQEMMRAFLRGDASTGETLAKQAAAEFRAGGNKAGAALASFEFAYAQQRLSEPDKCVAAAMAALPLAMSHHYYWVEIQLDLTLAVCEGMQQHFDTAYDTALKAGAIAGERGYSTLELRSLGMNSGILRQTGSYREALALDSDGLRRYWAGEGTRTSAYQFYMGLASSLDGLGYPQAAAAAMGEAVALSTAQSDRTMEAMARARFGEILFEAMRPDDASAQLRRAQELFREFPDTESSQLYRAYAMLSQARLDGVRGRVADGLAAVSDMEAQIKFRQNPAINMVLWQVKSELLTRAGRLRQSEVPLGDLLKLGDAAKRSEPTGGDPSALARHVSDAVNVLTERYVIRGSPADAWRVWTQYNSCLLEAPAGRSDTSSLVFANLPSGPVVLVRTIRGIFAVRLFPRQDLISLMNAFQRTVSDPEGAIVRVRDLGRRLEKELIQPVSQLLFGTRVLYIAADPPFSGIPFEALLSEDGRWLADRFRIVYSLPLGGAPRANTQKEAVRDLPFLAVSYGDESIIFGNRLRSLSGLRAETEAAAELFPRHILLDGSAASVAEVLSHLGTAAAFHFSGHAIVTAGDAALVLAPGTSAGDGGRLLWASQLSAASLRNLQLVVLAACSTGRAADSVRYPNADLARAFLLRGVPQAIASRWDVDSEATEKLVRSFYGLLGDNVQPGEALYRTAREFRESSTFAHPYYWASFEFFIR